MSNQKAARVDVDYTGERVPSSARKGFWPMFFIMQGFTFFSASMWTGVDLAKGLDLGGFMGAVLLGGVVLAAYTGALGYIGCHTGLSFDLLARCAFGAKGSYLPSAMIALTQIGWFGVGAAMFAIPAAQVLAPDSAVLPYVLVLAVGVCMTTSAYFGIKGLEIVSYVSVPLIALLGTYAMITATVQGGGLSAIFAKSVGDLTLFSGVGLVIGSFVSGGTATPNFTRFARSNKAAVWTTVIAFFIGNTLMFCFGGVAGAFVEQNDIFWVMIELNLGVFAFLVLGANIWTTNDNALYGVSSLNFAVELAEKYDRLVDVHCDEIDDEASRGLETLAARAYESGLKDRVTASYTTAMHSYNNAYVQRLMRLLKMSEINFVSNPLVNTHLQGRVDTYPKRRGVTRVKELTQAGVNVSFGHDDVFDPWYPMGTGSLRDVVFLGLHVCQMMGYEDIMNAYRFASTNAARTLHLGEDYGVRVGNAASFIVLDAKNYYDALNQNAAVLLSVKDGRVIAESQTGSRQVLF